MFIVIGLAISTLADTFPFWSVLMLTVKPIRSAFLQAVFQFSMLTTLLFPAALSAGAQQNTNPSPESTSGSFLKNSDISAGLFAQIAHPASNSSVHQSTNLSAGALLSFHTSYRWWLGADINYGYSHFAEQYRDGTPGNYLYTNVPTGMHELSAAYLVKAPKFQFKLHPYAEAGIGDLIFSPSVSSVTITTVNQIVPVSTQNRFTGLYAIGVDSPVFFHHLAARFEYRNLWYTAPSFGNKNAGFLDSTRPMFTQEPVVGIDYKF